MKLLIMGGYGFLGSNLAAKALALGYDVSVFDNLSRVGSERNRRWLHSLGKIRSRHGDVRNADDVNREVAEFCPDIVFHLAGQVAMTSSIQSPRHDFDTNAVGTFNVLEAVRNYAPACGVIYSSTNKVYGDLEQFRYDETATRYICLDRPLGFDETTPFESHSPYGCSKGTGDLYVLDYARTFALNTVVFRHSSMYGGRQFATTDQGWIAWFCGQAIQIANGELGRVTISGNGKQVRDILHAADVVALYFRAAERIGTVKGQAFNIGGGLENSLSLLELFRKLENLLSVAMPYDTLPSRPGDQKVFVADLSKARKAFDWMPATSLDVGIQSVVEWCRMSSGIA